MAQGLLAKVLAQISAAHTASPGPAFAAPSAPHVNSEARFWGKLEAFNSSGLPPPPLLTTSGHSPSRLPSLNRSKSISVAFLSPEGKLQAIHEAESRGSSSHGPRLQRSRTLPPLKSRGGPPASQQQKQSGGSSGPRRCYARCPSMCVRPNQPVDSAPQVDDTTLRGEESGGDPAELEKVCQGLDTLELAAAGPNHRLSCHGGGGDASTEASATVARPLTPSVLPAAAQDAEVQQMRGSLTARCAAAAQQWKSLEDFSAVRAISQGAHSTVWEAVPKCSSQRDLAVAVKAYDVAALGCHGLRRLLLEQRILTTVQHPHIIWGLGSFQEGGHCFLVMEHAGGRNLLQFIEYWHRRNQDDFERVSGATVVPEPDAAALVLAPLLDALSHLHESGIVHRDVKPANAVFDRSGRLRLIDFGLSLDEDSAEDGPRCQIGTRPYMAPELLGDHPPSLALVDRTDCWAVGCLAFQLLTGQPPWSHDVPACLYEMLREDPVPLGVLRAFGASPAAVGFICRALEKDPARRPTAAQLRAHPWLLRHAGGEAEDGSQFAA